MRYDRLFTKLYRDPVLLEYSAFIGLERVLIAHAATYMATGTKPQMSGFNKAARVERIVQMASENTAVVNMEGVIDKHISDFEMDCYGGYDLRDFDAAMQMLGNKDGIENIMMYVNSPGGSVTGVPESAAIVNAVANDKNVFAFTDGQMSSAAYYIASQADQIFAAPSADVGSIGVYAALLDVSRKMEKEGVVVNLIKDGKFKGMGAPFKPLTKEEHNYLQDRVNTLGTMFREAVNAKRPDVTNDVMQGQSFFGKAALAAGLVDAIVPDLQSALAQF